jgi:hydroxymethylpyrimidine pyrophosphatase-like HAD family hydrolase
MTSTEVFLFWYTTHMNKTSSINWNHKLRIAFSDVDETIADVYTPADSNMITELSSFLHDGRKLFMVTGGSLARVRRDITDHIEASLRHDILISHCSGAEVWGFTESGDLRDRPFYSIYENTFTPKMKQSLRDVVAQLVQEFDLNPHPAQPKVDFWEQIGRAPMDIMLDDRGPQITMEVVNGIDLTQDQLAQLSYKVPLTHGKHDLRAAIMERAIELLAEAKIPITPHFGGNFALDFAVEGVSKTTSIKSVLANPEVLATIGLEHQDVQNPAELEVWGDKYSILHGGTDRHMSEALPPEVRSIDFRQENPSEFPDGYNIVLWDGQQHLHHGLLEYLQSRRTN